MSKPDANLSIKELRKFSLLTAGMLILFFDLLLPWIWGRSMPVWPVVVAAILASMALVVPAALRPVYKVWMRFAEALGWVNTRIILGVIYFLIFLPVGVILRTVSDPMRRKYDEAADSYRISSHPTKPESMEKPF